MAKHLLDLSTLEPDRPIIAIDGTAYELAMPDDFGIAQHARLARLQKRIGDLATVDDLSDDELARVNDALTECIALMLPGAPHEVRHRLKDGQKLAIIRAFTQAAGIDQNDPPPPLTGEKSSRDSSDSTGDVPAIG